MLAAFTIKGTNPEIIALARQPGFGRLCAEGELKRSP